MNLSKTNSQGVLIKAWSWLTGHSNPGSILWNPHGIAVRETDAANNSAVMACVFWAMRNVGQAIPVVQTNGSRGWEGLTDHSLSELLRCPQGGIHSLDQTSLTGRKLLAAMVYSRMLDGNAYALKVRNSSGQLIGLDWLPHTVVEPVAMKERPNVVDYYEVRSSAGTERVAKENIVHDMDGIDPHCPAKGISRLKCVMRQVQTDNQIAAYSQSLLSNPIPSLLVSAKGDGIRLSQSDADYVAQKMREVSSREKAGGVVVPTFPAEVTPIGFKPDDLAVGQLNKLPEERITAVLGIPAVVVGLGAGLERSTFSNMKEAREAATEEFLVPLWQDLASTFTEQLLPEFGSMDNLRVWFDTSAVGTLQEDQDALHKRVREDFRAGLLDRASAKVELGIPVNESDYGQYWVRT